MALEIIDGFAGAPHIDSTDLAALHQGMIGPGSYVLKDFGNQMKATMATSNSVTVATGAICFKGRRAVNLAAQSLTVASGTAGQKRNDLVVATYAKNSTTGVETMTLSVVKGTATTGTAADPSVTSNQMKLWRIPINGITAGAPVQLFETVPSTASVWDSVSQAGWMPKNDGTRPWFALDLGTVRLLALNYVGWSAPVGTSSLAVTIPSGAAFAANDWAGTVSVLNGSAYFEAVGAQLTDKTAGGFRIITQNTSSVAVTCDLGIVMVGRRA